MTSPPPPAGGDGRPAAVPVVVATVLRPEGGTGVQTHVGELARHLEARHLPCTVVTPFSAGGVLRDATFAVRRVLAPVSGAAGVAWYRWGHRLFLERALKRHLAGAGPAVVYCQCPVSAAAALRARRGPGQPVVMAVHFWVSQADEWAGKGEITEGGRVFRAVRRLERRVLAEVDAVVYVSEAARRDLWTSPPATVPTATVPNFLATAGDGPGSGGRGAGTRADLVSVGSLEPRKNHRYLLDVLAAARRQGHAYTLDIVGGGPERGPLLRRAAELGLARQVRLPGYVPGAAGTLPGYRAYLHPARHEPFGLAILEAMRAGVPPVAAPVGGVPGLFDAGVEGLHWDLGDPEQGARTLVGLLEDEPGRARMGAAARARFLRQFQAAAVAPVLHEFLVSRVSRVAGPAGTAALATPA